MKYYLLGLLLFASGTHSVLGQQPQKPFGQIDQQLATLQTDTALMYPSESVDEYPLWSPDGHYLAVNVEGDWQKVDFATVSLAPATWHHGQALGVIQNKSAVSNATDSEIAAWKKSNSMNPRKANVGGTIVELRLHELSTALVITSPGKKPQTRWESDEENCHSLVVAPDQAHVAFICELNGVFVLRIPE